MKHVVSIIRSSSSVDVVTLDDRGHFEEKHFPKTFTNSQAISAALSASPAAENVPASPASPPPQPETAANSAADPSARDVPNERLTRQQMIDALDRADLHDYNPRSFFSVQAAYRKLSACGTAKKN